VSNEFKSEVKSIDSDEAVVGGHSSSQVVPVFLNLAVASRLQLLVVVVATGHSATHTV